MAVEAKVGVEAEFLVMNSKDEIVMPPAHWPRDGFPLLAEIQADPGTTTAETIGHFEKAKLEAITKVQNLSDGPHKAVWSTAEHVSLDLYRRALRATDWSIKQESMGKVKNIYGVDIEDFSDQVVKAGKIVGAMVSCGLHLHFSCEEKVEVKYEDYTYKEVCLPLSVSKGKEALFDSSLLLYRRYPTKEPKVITARAGKLNTPSIRFIVKGMDKAFFERFVPKERTTKFRQPGFYELKPWGFEYRSLPCNTETIAALPEIVSKAFELLNECK